MSEVSDRIANLSPEKMALLMQKLAEKKKTTAPRGIQQVDRSGNQFPLSTAQQRLWFLEQMVPGTAVYNIPMATRLRGPLQPAALREAVQEIVRRHETLRTSFQVVDGQPVQVITAVSPQTSLIELPIINLQTLAADEREQEAQKLALAEAQKPFDISQAPLLRVKLLQLGAQEFVLLVTMHHLITDGWSLGVFLRELMTLVQGYGSGKATTLPPLTVQYIDYAAWQRTMLTQAKADAQLEYWTNQLGGRLPVLDLPTDCTRPALQSYSGSHYPINISGDLLAELRQMSQQEGVTLFMLLLAAFNVLLYRYTGQTDCLVGTPIANRTKPELEGLIGFFVNTLVMRNDLSGNPSFQELLHRVQKVALSAYKNRDLPFEKLVETLQPNRDLGRSPLFQVLFVHMDAPMGNMQFADIDVEPLDVNNGTAQYDLSLYCIEGANGISGFIEYNTDLFTEQTMARLMGHYQEVLTAVTHTPSAPINDIPLLTNAEKEQLLVSMNDTAAPIPMQPVHQLIQKQAAATPTNIAVVSEDNAQQFTYAQLDTRANQLARHLQAAGVTVGTRVGLCVNRSPNMVVGLLGILKAGGTYIPIDPTYPAERIRYVLEDANAPVLITESELVPTLPTDGKHVICLDADWGEIGCLAEEPVDVETAPDDLAYIIYTSGSTGKPKGVQIPHHALVNFLVSMQKEPGILPEDTLLAVTTLSFDIAGLELFMPLIAGAKVVIATEAVVNDGARLQQVLVDSGTTIMQATPATWQLLLAAGWQGMSGLKMLCGGEAFPRDLANALVDCGESLWNMYGPTETTIWSAVHRVEKGEGVVPIGHPIANTQLYVLDPQQQPVPIGVPGELYIGGDGVASGYVNRPELTADRFVEIKALGDHGQPTTDGRLPNIVYRTGDLVRYRADGTLVFIARMDNQVKVRGFRIELGEIETVLGQHEQVRQGVVMVHEAAGGDKRLVAYVLPEGDAPTISDIRGFLSKRLPSYMVVTDMMVMDSFPLTPNGKIDRKALPAPTQERPELTAVYTPPRNEMEQTLVDIWQSVLGVDQIGVYDNFFDLGGHSLLATSLLFKVEQAFGMDIPVLTFFRAPHIAQMARVLAAKQAGAEIPLDGEGEMLSLRDEVVLDVDLDGVTAVSATQITAPQHIFLTGVTGFVGAFLLDELLRKTDATIHCLVRAEDESAGMARIWETLVRFRIEGENGRIRPITGNLTQPNFGLSDAAYKALAQQIDVIYHSAANTNFIYPYPELKATNVNGTREIIKLAAAETTKPLHYISTLYVFGEPDFAEHTTIPEQVMPAYPEALPIGYAQSKWVAEHILQEARES